MKVKIPENVINHISMKICGQLYAMRFELRNDIHYDIEELSARLGCHPGELVQALEDIGFTIE